MPAKLMTYSEVDSRLRLLPETSGDSSLSLLEVPGHVNAQTTSATAPRRHSSRSSSPAPIATTTNEHRQEPQALYLCTSHGHPHCRARPEPPPRHVAARKPALANLCCDASYLPALADSQIQLSTYILDGPRFLSHTKAVQRAESSYEQFVPASSLKGDSP